MKTSENYGFYLPSRDDDDIADINQISHNFKVVDLELSKSVGRLVEIEITGNLYYGEIFNDYKNNVASAPFSHAEGYMTQATDSHTHSEGTGTKATVYAAHSEGEGTEASAEAAHSEGYITKATGFAAHSEGEGTEASAEAAHSGGYYSIASDIGSFVHGSYLQSGADYQAVFGRGNVQSRDALFVVGNGDVIGVERSNAFEVKDDGSAIVQKQGQTVDSVVQKQYVDGIIGDIETALDNIIAIQEALIGGAAV